MNANDHQLQLSYAGSTDDRKEVLKGWAASITVKLLVRESFWLGIVAHKFVMSQGMLF